MSADDAPIDTTASAAGSHVRRSTPTTSTTSTSSGRRTASYASMRRAMAKLS